MKCRENETGKQQRSNRKIQRDFIWYKENLSKKKILRERGRKRRLCGYVFSLSLSLSPSPSLSLSTHTHSHTFDGTYTKQASLISEFDLQKKSFDFNVCFFPQKKTSDFSRSFYLSLAFTSSLSPSLPLSVCVSLFFCLPVTTVHAQQIYTHTTKQISSTTNTPKKIEITFRPSSTTHTHK